MFRLVIILGQDKLKGSWYKETEWTIQEVQELEQLAHLTGASWYLEFI